jgi:hypothetical protein
MNFGHNPHMIGTIGCIWNKTNEIPILYEARSRPKQEFTANSKIITCYHKRSVIHRLQDQMTINHRMIEDNDE